MVVVPRSLVLGLEDGHVSSFFWLTVYSAECPDALF